MTDQELREKIEAILEAGEMMLNPPEDLNEFIDKGAVKKSRVDQVLACIKEAGYVRLAEDQSLPDVCAEDMPSSKSVQHDMVLADWRKVEL